MHTTPGAGGTPQQVDGRAALASTVALQRINGHHAGVGAVIPPLIDRNETFNWTTASAATGGRAAASPVYFAVCLATKDQNQVK
jgi:hypothetical protein